MIFSAFACWASARIKQEAFATLSRTCHHWEVGFLKTQSPTVPLPQAPMNLNKVLVILNSHRNLFWSGFVAFLFWAPQERAGRTAGFSIPAAEPVPLPSNWNLHPHAGQENGQCQFNEGLELILLVVRFCVGWNRLARRNWSPTKAIRWWMSLNTQPAANDNWFNLFLIDGTFFAWGLLPGLVNLWKRWKRSMHIWWHYRARFWARLRRRRFELLYALIEMFSMKYECLTVFLCFLL